MSIAELHRMRLRLTIYTGSQGRSCEAELGDGGGFDDSAPWWISEDDRALCSGVSSAPVMACVYFFKRNNPWGINVHKKK
jgi:hypothetical protein